MGQSQIDYWIEVSGDLENWITLQAPDSVEVPSYGWERVSNQRLEDLPGIDRERGFARLRIWNHDWNHETTTPILAWAETAFEEGYQTHGVSLNMAPVYASSIAEVDLQRGRLTMASGGLTTPGLAEGAVYLELMNGEWEGHRWAVDIEASSDQVVALDLTSATNTLAALPESGVRFSQAVIRRHRTLGEVYPPALFAGHTDPATADQLQFYRGNGYQGYFLLDGGGRLHWTPVGDARLNDSNQTSLPPGEGGFLKRAEGQGGVRLLVVGHLREHDFLQRIGTAYSLLASPTPLDGSPSSWGLSTDRGLVGHTDPASADQLQLWLGDWIEGGQGYQSYFLLDAGQPSFNYWTGIQDQLLRNEDESELFEGDRAFFFRSVEETPRWVRIPGPNVRSER